MTDSPFLPGTNIQYAWDSTSLGDLKRCARLYYYNMIAGWASKEESIHLRFGIEYHQALHDYELSRAAGVKHDDAVFDTTRALLLRTTEFNPEHKSKTRENLVRSVVWYLEQFRDDVATTVILSDGKPAMELSFRFELDWGTKDHPYLLCGHLDRVVNYVEETFVMDRKTTTLYLGDYYYNQFEPNNQMTLYTLASKVVLNAPVKGVIIDAASIQEDYTKFGRTITYRTQDQLEEWLFDLRYWFALAEQYAVANYWPMNDTSCDKYGGCKYRQICNKSPSVRERFLEGTFNKLTEEERWNPLKPR